MRLPDWFEDDAVREAIEAELPIDARTTLSALVRGAAAYRGGWLAVPAWRQTFGTAAALAIIAEATDDGCTREAALDRASDRLGVPTATVLSWLRRAQSQARKCS